MTATCASYVRLGRSALSTSRLWLGTVNFSGRLADEDALRLMDHACDRGINCFDTADIYGWRLHKGHTEQLVGKWLARGGGRRADTVLATKAGGAMSERINDSGLSARGFFARALRAPTADRCAGPAAQRLKRYHSRSAARAIDAAAARLHARQRASASA